MLRLETVTPTLLKIIQTISGEPHFSDFRLVGGTALSLYLGHRKSVDADFFSNKEFDQNEAAKKLGELLPGFMMLKKSKHGFTGVYQGVKIDLYTWGMTFLEPPFEAEEMRMADIRDVAALKMEAVTNRKEEKDFRDIHTLLKQFSLDELIDLFIKRYPEKSPRIFTDHLLAAPFVDPDESIELFDEISKRDVSNELVAAVKNYYQQKANEKQQEREEALRKRIQDLKNRKK